LFGYGKKSGIENTYTHMLGFQLLHTGVSKVLFCLREYRLAVFVGYLFILTGMFQEESEVLFPLLPHSVFVCGHS